MYPRAEYEMTKEDLVKILEACKPTPAISFNGIDSIGGSPQENSNRAWAELGKKMGFDSMTVKPISGKGNQFFTAVPSETSEQRREREDKEAKEAKDKKVKQLKEEIKDKEEELGKLQNDAM